ncbi:MAG: hypothetical protein SLAVMIC_00848 [uncultured marine phage]|uniref:Uncharacterized protein n=1 Tax=uncultured marine phage TaxID=707152 RepID=A0A8D9C9M3_9VIRU|nr:MAG: hypothetical protein SLAVMIC_00848 [uncultured marine phage]
MKYLKPYKIFESNSDITKYIEKIKRDCQPFIKLMRKELGSEIDQWIKEIDMFFTLENSGTVSDYLTFVETNDSEEVQILKGYWKTLGDERYQSIESNGIFYKSPFIFRGFGEGGSGLDNNDPYYTTFTEKDYSSREVDRKPLDMNLGTHKLLDEYFDKKFGVRLRSKGVFTSTWLLAKSYGIPFLFFPTGNFDYYWSPEVRDLYKAVDQTDWYDEIYNYPDNYDNSFLRLAMNDIKHLVGSYLKNERLGEGLETKDSILKGSREITFVCGKHYLLNANKSGKLNERDKFYIIKSVFQGQ